MFKYVIIYFPFLGVIYGLSVDVPREEQNPSWILQLGLRGITRDVSTVNKDNTAINELSVPNNIPAEIQGRSSSQTIKKSTIPLVDLGGRFYHFGTYFKTNFFKAMQFCRDYGMDLLSIETNEENARIVNYIMLKEQNIDHFWTSGSDLGEEGHFVWLATGKRFNFTFWSPPQPDNAGNVEHCTEIWKLADKHYIWNDIPCGNEYNFICEVQKCNDFCLS